MKCLRAVAALMAALCAGIAMAQTPIYVGQSAGFTGPAAGSVKEVTEGARIYLDSINARGGVNGRLIELISLDDKFDPAQAAVNAKRLITERKVSALFMTRGTPHTEALLPLLTQYKVPLIAPSTGAMVFHQPVNRYVFNVRSTYQRESERVVMHLGAVGFTRIGLLQVNDSFGDDVAAGALRAFKRINLEPAVNRKFDRKEPAFAPLVKELVAANAQAVIIVGVSVAVVDVVKQLRAAGSRAQIVTFSNNASSNFVKALGPDAHGTLVAQVFPGERSLAIPMVRELHELARAKGVTEISPQMIEGFAAAKVLVEALRRAGRELTTDTLIQALESINAFDLGGLRLSFSPTDHTGLEFVDLSIVDSNGKFRR